MPTSLLHSVQTFLIDNICVIKPDRRAWSMLKIVVHYMKPAWMLLEGQMKTSCKVDVTFHIQEPALERADCMYIKIPKHLNRQKYRTYSELFLISQVSR